jgi:hypothetical protein
MIREPGDTKIHHQSDADLIESIGNEINALVTERVRATYPKFARFGPQWMKVYDEAVSNMRRAARQMYDLKRVMILHEQDVLDREDLPMRIPEEIR